MDIKGVITGDIVSSTSIKLEWREALLQKVHSIAEELHVISDLRIEFFRGDSFQIIVAQPEATQRIAVLLRAGLMANTPTTSDQPWDARLSVGIGEVSFLSDSVVISDGEAFRLSGRGMDGIKKRKLVVTTRWQNINDELAVSTAFVDDIVSGWTQPQAEVVYLSLLRQTTQKDVAQQVGKSPQTISGLMTLAKESLVADYLERFEKLILNEMNK